MVHIAAIVVGSAGFYFGRASAPKAADAHSRAIARPTPGPSPSTDTDPVLGRADIIAMVATATDALVAGAPVPGKIRSAVGRRFELSVPFGCAGPAEQGSLELLRWRYDESEETLRLHVEPTTWSLADWGLPDTAKLQAIEGYWIARPWSSGSDCPRASSAGRSTGIAPVTLAGQTVAVAQFFTDETRREALRSGRAFESVQRIPRNAFKSPVGFRFVLSGRIGRVPGAGPVRCVQPGGIEQRPICVVAVKLDEVRIESPATGEVVASWPISGG